MSGLYIHIPFCRAKCSYCDFYSMPLKDSALAGRYIDSLLTELKIRIHEIPDSVKTLYIGGGTPSSLPVAEMMRLVNGVKEQLGTSSFEEFTIEANPEDICEEWCEAILRTGAGRISIGIQSLDDRELYNVGRRHDADKAIRAISTMRNCGITEISGDIIYGLPGQTTDSWNQTLESILELGLPHISAYSLSYEPGTRLTAMMNSGKVRAVDDDTVVEMYEALITRMRARGYHHYEISNFAIPGHEARHNSSYWDFTPYLGLGPGAHSFDGSVRRSNPSNLRKYMDTVSTGNPFADIEEETVNDLINDYIITGLRRDNGIDLDAMTAIFGKEASLRLESDAGTYINAGHLTVKDKKLRFDEKSWIISDMVLRELLQ